jgi:hypothetical protein
MHLRVNLLVCTITPKQREHAYTHGQLYFILEHTLTHKSKETTVVPWKQYS